jgi:thioredoxin 1
LAFPLLDCLFRHVKWILYAAFLCHISISHAFGRVTFFHHLKFQPHVVATFLHSPQLSTMRQTRRFMSTKGVSKTGGRLLESTEDYRQMVLDGAIDRPILVFWTAPWCGPCRISIPVVKDIMHAYSDQMDTVEVCTDDLPDLVANAGVVSIPTIHIYFQGMCYQLCSLFHPFFFLKFFRNNLSYGQAVFWILWWDVWRNKCSLDRWKKFWKTSSYVKKVVANL